MNGRSIVVRGDARNLPLPDASVDLICTSPPYYGLRSYTDGGQHYDGQIGDEAAPADYVDNLLDCTREWMRVLKPEGSLWINLGDKYAQRPGQFGPQGKTGQRASRAQAATYVDAPARQDLEYDVAPKSLLGMPWRYALGVIDRLGLILRAEVIWSKANGLPESVVDRVRRSHEQWFHFVKQPRYYSAVDEVREPHRYPLTAVQMARRVGSSKSSLTHSGDLGPGRANGEGRREEVAATGSNPLGKMPGSVWEIPTQPLKAPDRLGVDHYAAFPIELPRRIIRGWSPPGAVVVDPFGGTGTTALVAASLGRTGVSLDRSADYCRLAVWRTSDPGERARALGLPKPPPENPAQERLFGESA